MAVKEFKGNPKVYVASCGGSVEVTTDEHMRNANRPLESILREICEQAEEYAKKIFHDYDYPNGKWYPCGSADIVLRWNNHREIIQLFRKQADRVDDVFITVGSEDSSKPAMVGGGYRTFQVLRACSTRKRSAGS